MIPSVLKSNYNKFRLHCLRETLTPEEQKWLKAWEMWDLACSPMDDKQRSLIRYGYYLGWTHATDYNHED